MYVVVYSQYGSTRVVGPFNHEEDAYKFVRKKRLGEVYRLEYVEGADAHNL